VRLYAPGLLRRNVRPRDRRRADADAGLAIHEPRRAVRGHDRLLV